MPYTFNGIGTTLYGKRDFGADGSYITTEWFVLAYLPLLPLHSFRILETGEDRNYLVYSSTGFRRGPKTRPNRKQVLAVYGFAVAVAGSVYFGAFVSRLIDSPAVGLLVIFGIMLMPYWLRRAARKGVNRYLDSIPLSAEVGENPSVLGTISTPQSALDRVGEFEICPKCEFKNNSHFNFCGSCGSSLGRPTCRNCQTRNNRGFKFCGACGKAIA